MYVLVARLGFVISFAFRLIRDFRQFCVALENFALCMIKDFAQVA